MKSDQDRLTYFVILQLISDAQTAREIEPLVLLLHYCWVDVIWNMFFAKKKEKLSKDYIWLHACKAGVCTPELEVNPHASLSVRLLAAINRALWKQSTAQAHRAASQAIHSSSN
jgi:hypothetical protein